TSSALEAAPTTSMSGWPPSTMAWMRLVAGSSSTQSIRVFRGASPATAQSLARHRRGLRPPLLEHGHPPDEGVLGGAAVDPLQLVHLQVGEEQPVLHGLIGGGHGGVVRAHGHGDAVLEEGEDGM